MIFVDTVYGELVQCADPFLPWIPFKAQYYESGEWAWFVQSDTYVRQANRIDVSYALQRLNEMFCLEETEDEFALDTKSQSPRVKTPIGFDCVYNNINEALDYLVEGLKQDDFYDMLEVIERKD
jgi:hypothetical protein